MLRTFLARLLKSPKFPIGVETIYRPFSKLSISLVFIFILSCVPVNNYVKNVKINEYSKDSQEKVNLKKKLKNSNESNNNKNLRYLDQSILSEIEIILPKMYNKDQTSGLIKAFELALYKNEIKNIQLNINEYLDLKDLDKIMSVAVKPGKIFVGTFNEEESKIVKNYCKKGILFFSFSSNINLANDCAYLINFFPSDDLRALFAYFPKDSKVALLYPENFYGLGVNSIIDNIAQKNNSLIISRASYNEDLSNARDAIKRLGKYEIRRLELEKQKKILKNKDDEISRLALKKIKKFETIGNVDFTHIIIPDYGIRLLEISPLLPFYDVDPEKVQFVGTGTWDDEVFFDEPTLQNSIFPGIEEEKRSKFFDDYFYVYKEKPMRTATIPYDLVGLFSYLLNNDYTIKNTLDFLNNSQIKFDGIDGKFYFKKNIILRDLDILKIKNGEAKKLN